MAGHSGLGAGYSSCPRMIEEPRFRRISDNLLWKYRLWITYDADLEEYLITEPWPVLDDIEYMVSRYAKFSIRYDPRRGLPHSLERCLLDHAECESCGCSPPPDFSACSCGSNRYSVSSAIWENGLGPLYRKDLAWMKGKRRELRKEVAALESGRPQHVPGDIELLRSAQDDACYYCGISISNGFHIEHLTPLASGGGDDIYNIMLACPACNLSKGPSSEAAYWRQLKRELPDQEFIRRRDAAKLMKQEKQHRLRTSRC